MSLLFTMGCHKESLSMSYPEAAQPLPGLTQTCFKVGETDRGNMSLMSYHPVNTFHS